MKKKLWNKRGLALLTAAALALSSFQPVLAAGNAVNVEARAESTVITDLKTNDLRNPVGIDTVNPSFSWKMESNVLGQYQKAYQIEVARDSEFTDMVWDSGKKEDGNSVGITYAGEEALEPSSAYFWRVKVTDKEGKAIVSETARFEIGLIGNEGWNQSQWIQVGTSTKPPAPVGKEIHYVIEADIEIVNNSVSPLIEAKDKQNYLLWQFNNNRASKRWVFKPHRVTNGPNYTTLREIDVNDWVRTDTAVQHMKVEVTGSEITTYLNDHEIVAIPVSEVGGVGANGEIGLLGFRSHEIDQEKGFMDNITITDYSSDPNGVIVKNYTFEDGENPFDLGTIENGRLNTSFISGETIALEKTAEDNLTPVHYQVTAEVTCETEAISLLFNGVDTSNFYMFQLNTKDTPGKVLFKPHTWNDGNISTYTEHTKDVTGAVGSVEELKTTPVSVLIDVTEKEIKTYLNEQLIDTFPISDSRGIAPIAGSLGFRAEANENGTVDNFKLTDYTDDAENGKVIYNYDFEGENPFTKGTIKDGKFVASQLGILFPPQASGVPTFRKSVTPKAELVSAKLYTAGLGVYDAFINGERVGTRLDDGSMKYDELKPGYTHFQKRTIYHTYDVTQMLEAGKENILSAHVTSGWWTGRVAGPGGKKEAFRAQLLLNYADGTSEVIGTDNSWKTSLQGPLLMADIYDGETYDATADVSFRKTGYDDSEWTYAEQNTEFSGEICSQVGPSIQVREDLELTAKSAVVYDGAEGADDTKYGKIHETGRYASGESFVLKAGETAVFDMGQNFAGWDEITVEGQKGTKLTMRHGEMLNDREGLKSRGNDGPEGSIYTENLRSAQATGRYIMSGEGRETYHATATFYGFQYVEVTTTEDVTIHGMKGIVVTSVAEDTGSVSTSDEDVNQLISNIFWGQYSNYLSTATDCPQRDERRGWTADAQVFSTAACYNADSKGFLRKYMADMRDSQIDDPNDRYYGAYPDTAPYNIYKPYGEIGQLGWGDAGIIIPYNLYKMYGDSAVIEENYDCMQKFMDYFMKSTNKWGGEHNHGDHLAYEDNGDDVKNAFGIAYYAWDAQMMAEMAAVLGKTEDVEKYQKVYEEEKAFFQENFVQKDGSLRRTEQTVCLMALKMDLLPDENSRQLAKQALLDNIKRNGNKLQTGFLGTAIIMQTLSDIGATDVAYQLLLQHGNPSWLYSVDQGATTIWERWNSYTLEGGFGPVSMNSFNHYAYGAVAEWMYGYMAGIMYDTENPGFRRIVLQPSPDQSLEKVDCSYESAYGTIESNWKYEKGMFCYNATVPANTTAAIYVPVEENRSLTVNGKAPDKVTKETDGITYVKTENGKAVFEAGSGSYEFSTAVSKYYSLKLEKSDDAVSGDVSINGGSAQSLPCEIRIKEGDTVAIQALPPKNDVDYTFAGWNGDAISDDFEVKVTAEKDIALTANYKKSTRKNLALNKPVSSNNGMEIENWRLVNLVDGILTSAPGSLGFTTNPYKSPDISEPCWIEIDLGEDMAFDRVQLYPRSDTQSSSQMAANFPRDFTLEVRGSGEADYRIIGTYKDQNVTAEKPAVYEFDTVYARYVRINVSKLGDLAAADPLSYYVQLAEMGVYAPVPIIEKVVVAPAAAEVKQGETQQFTAEVSGQYDPDQDVRWTVEGNTSEKTAISAEGLLTVGTDETAKTMTVRAVSAQDHTKEGTAEVTVIEKEIPTPPQTVKVSQITVKADDSRIFTGEKTSVKATVLPVNAENKKVTWTSSDSSIAMVDGNGVVSAKKAGTVTVTATAADGSSVSGKCTIQVVKPTVKLNASSAKLQRGKSTKALKVSGLQKGDKIKSWSSSNTRVATVNRSGKITAKKIGTAKITVTTVKGAKATCKLKVIKGKVKTTKITVKKTKISLKKGQRYSLEVQRVPVTATERITYKTSDKKVAAVSKKGIITARKKGKARIVIRTSNGKTKRVTVTVK